MAIKYTALDHGLWYMFRLHEEKLAKVNHNGFSGLHRYLNNVFEACPNNIFKEGPRSSDLKFLMDIKKVEVRGHEVCSWADLGLKKYAKFKTAHSKVQLCMLENDAKTIAVEVPIWLKPTDLVVNNLTVQNSLYKKLFAEGLLTGHIDIVAVDNELVWIWDYKPNAHKERYASTQVFFYALMLSQRTGIPLNYFRCGYFDDKVAYLFRPELSALK